MNKWDLAVAENDCHQNFWVQLSMLETKDVMGQLVPFFTCFFSHSYLSRAILGFIAAYSWSSGPGSSQSGEEANQPIR